MLHKKCRNTKRPQEAQIALKSGRKEAFTMDEKAIEARRAYKREWQRNNPDKVRAQQERYWQKKAAAKEREQGATHEQESNI
jgi:hypothetical protein